MPRRAIIDRARLDAMLALPEGEAEVTLRALTDVGEALVRARAEGDDVGEAVGAVVPWERLPAVLAEARRLIRPDGPDYAAVAADSHTLLRRIGPAFLATFTFRGVRAVRPLLDAVAMRSSPTRWRRSSAPAARRVPTGSTFPWAARPR